MQLGIIGLGKMGANMAERLRRGGHEIIGFDRNPDHADVGSVEELIGRLQKPRSVWIMVPAGDATYQTVDALGELLEAGDVRAIGPLLSESHVSMRDDYEISCRELDLVVDTALDSGALGARMTGGGFGGSAIALVESADVARIRTRILEAFAAAGLTEPGFVDASPGDGYGPLR